MIVHTPDDRWMHVWEAARAMESATTEEECRALYDAAVQADRTAALVYAREGIALRAVEIGTWCGRTACVLGYALAGGRMDLTTIDRFEPFVDVGGLGLTKPPPREQVLHYLAERRCPINVDVVKGDSPTVAREVWSGTVGFLFIDGNHEYHGPVNDWRAWSPHLHRDAIVCWHDYRPHEPNGPYCAVLDCVNPLIAQGLLHVIDQTGTLLVTALHG